MLVSPAICGTLLSRYGTEHQRSTWLPPLASGRDKMAFAITEPDAGSNSHRISTTARRDGDEWVLTGTKYFISGADEAGAVLVVARTGTDEVSGRAQLSLFIVGSGSPGLTLAPIAMEIRAPEKQFTLFFDDVAVGADSLLGDEGEGFRQVFAGLNPERLMSAALASGIGLYALAAAAGYARERSIWGVPIGSHQGLAHPLARAKIDLELARLMAQKAAWCYDNGIDAGEPANMAKYGAAEAGLQALDQAIQTYGGNGLATEHRPRRPVGARAAHADGAGEPGDDPQLRRPALARSPEVLLSSGPSCSTSCPRPRTTPAPRRPAPGPAAGSAASQPAAGPAPRPDRPPA